MGRQQHTCGAVTGAIMVLGLQFGKGKLDDNARKLATYEKTVAFFEAFRKEEGSTECLELLEGLHMSIPEEMKKIEQLEFHRLKCTGYIRDAVAIVEKLIHESNQ